MVGLYILSDECKYNNEEFGNVLYWRAARQMLFRSDALRSMLLSFVMENLSDGKTFTLYRQLDYSWFQRFGYIRKKDELLLS